MPGGQCSPGDVVDGDGASVVRVEDAVDEHQVSSDHAQLPEAWFGSAVGDDDRPGRTLFREHLEVRQLDSGVVVTHAESECVASPSRSDRDRFRDGRVERIDQFRHHYAQELVRPASQRGGCAIGNEIETLHRLTHSFSSGLGNEVGAIDRVRDGRHGDARSVGDPGEADALHICPPGDPSDDPC